MSAQSVDAYLIFGRLAVKYKLMAPEKLKLVVDAQSQLQASGQTAPFGDVCVSQGLLSTDQRDKIVAVQQKAPVKREGSYFGYLALVNGFLNQKQLSVVLKEQEDARAKAGGKGPKIGELLVTKRLMSPGQVHAILGAQKRIRERLGKAKGETARLAAAGAGGAKAAEALARLAQFEQQFGGAVEIKIESEELPGLGEAALPVANPASSSAGEAEAEAELLPMPPTWEQDIFTTGALEMNWDQIEAASLSTREPVAATPVAATPVEPISPANADDFGLGAFAAAADEIEVVAAGAAPIDEDEPPPLAVAAQELNDAPVASDLPKLKADSGGKAKGKTETKSAPPAETATPVAAANADDHRQVMSYSTISGTSLEKMAQAAANAASGEHPGGFKGRRANQIGNVEIKSKDPKNIWIIGGVGLLVILVIVYTITSMIVG